MQLDNRKGEHSRIEARSLPSKKVLGEAKAGQDVTLRLQPKEHDSIEVRYFNEEDGIEATGVDNKIQPGIKVVPRIQGSEVIFQYIYVSNS